MSAGIAVDRLAQALYETDAGSAGELPTHTRLSWQEYRACTASNRHLERAAAMLRLLGDGPRGATKRGPRESTPTVER